MLHEPGTRQTLIVRPPQAKSLRDNVTSILQREFEAAKEYVPSAKDWLSSYWSGFMSPHQKARIRNTGAPCRRFLLHDSGQLLEGAAPGSCE